MESKEILLPHINIGFPLGFLPGLGGTSVVAVGGGGEGGGLLALNRLFLPEKYKKIKIENKQYLACSIRTNFRKSFQPEYQN